MKNNIVTILCSGVALGVYIPALIVDYQLKANNVSTDVVVLENLLLNEKKLRIIDNKKAFHKSFRFALTGQKMASDIFPNCDANIIKKLFQKWAKEKRQFFIIFSGFWMSILKKYVKEVPGKKLKVDIVHMDADISTSWKPFQEESKNYNNIWLFKGSENKLEYEIPVTYEKPIPYHKRLDRYVIHGGGWGMGTYMNKISELEDIGLDLDIVAYFTKETENPRENNRYFMIDPNWSPWLKNKMNLHEFPLFSEIKEDKKSVFKNKPEYHDLFDVIRKDRAIISKPGGATLLDSLSSATPLIMLEPFGSYEQKNAYLWENLGFGIPYENWKKSGYDDAVLKILHNNLLKTRGTMKNYITDYIKKNFN